MKSFNNSDIFINRVKTYPKTSITVHSGNVYYNNNFNTTSSVIFGNALPEPIAAAAINDTFVLPWDYNHLGGNGGLSPILLQNAYETAGAHGDAIVPADTLIAQPLYVGTIPRYITKLGLIRATYFTADIKLAVYYDDDTGTYPGELLHSFTGVSGGAFGLATTPGIVPVLLPAGLVWLVMKGNGSGSTIMHSNGLGGNNVFAYSLGTTPGASGTDQELYSLIAYDPYMADMPATFPSGAAVGKTTSNGAYISCIAVLP